MRVSVLRVLIGLPALLLGSMAWAAPITVVNPSFEANVVGDGGFTTTITGWTASGASNSGTFNPQAFLYPGGIPDGQNVVFSNGQTVAQVLSAALTANTYYTLQTAVGIRSDGSAPASHTIELWAGATKVASASPVVSSVGTFVTGTAQYFARVDDPQLGQPLEIRLVKTGSPQANFDVVRLDGSAAVMLQNPTALFSQGGFPVSEAIDGDTTQNSGWAGSAGPSGNPTPANTAAFETQSNQGFQSGTVLTFRLDQQYPLHSIGKFRLSVTTDDRSTFADGLANGGDVTANWVPLAPLSAASAGGATMAIEADNAIFVSGAYPSIDTYTVTATTSLTGITGVRLEMLEDPRLSDSLGGVGGPGRTGHGNYVLNDFRVVSTKLLQNATATFSQGGFTVDEAIDEDLSSGSGWAIASSGTEPQTAAFETSVDLGFVGGTLLTFTLDQQYPGHGIGKFRLSATTDDRVEFADGLANGGDVTANWVELVPVGALSANGTTLTVNPDNSILASGINPSLETYTVSAFTSMTGITGFRLELLGDPSLPTAGPGRAGNGNLVLTNFRVDAAPIPEPSTLVMLLGLGGIGLLGCLRRRRRS